MKSKEKEGWREGLLCFKQKPFAEIMKDLERYYDVRIILEKSSIAPIVPVSYTHLTFSFFSWSVEISVLSAAEVTFSGSAACKALAESKMCIRDR